MLIRFIRYRNKTSVLVNVDAIESAKPATELRRDGSGDYPTRLYFHNKRRLVIAESLDTFIGRVERHEREHDQYNAVAFSEAFKEMERR